jgi:sugar phosphate isomerase/epimerase
MYKKKLFISNLAWNHFDSKKVLKLLKNYSIDGIDLAPIKINHKWKNSENSMKKFYKQFSLLGFEINAIQGIFYKTNFNLFKKLHESKIYNHLFKMIKISKILNCNKIIIGSSNFRNNDKLSLIESDIIFLNFFKKIVPLLKKHKIYICFEPIPKNYGEKYLNDIDKLANLIKKLKTPWFGINFDTSIYHFNKFNKNNFLNNQKIIKNIQISEKKFSFFTHPSKFNLLFAQLLKKNKFVRRISLEIISKNTDLKKLSISLKNFKQLFN